MASGSGWNLWMSLVGDGYGWNLWMWLVGAVVRRLYRFPHIIYPYSSCIHIISVLFLVAASQLFCSLFKKLGS